MSAAQAAYVVTVGPAASVLVLVEVTVEIWVEKTVLIRTDVVENVIVWAAGAGRMLVTVVTVTVLLLVVVWVGAVTVVVRVLVALRVTVV